jgi:hypothetical protein
LPSCRVMQPQLAFSTHSGSQLHAGAPVALSSQYQPARHDPLPQAKHVPSSQLEARGASGLESSESESASLEEPELESACVCSAASALRASGAALPPQASESTRAVVVERPKHNAGDFMAKVTSYTSYTQDCGEKTGLSPSHDSLVSARRSST